MRGRARTATRDAHSVVPLCARGPRHWAALRCAEQSESKAIECLAHLIALPGITVEDRDEIEAALSHCRNGIDLPMRCILLRVARAANCLRSMTGVTRVGQRSFASTQRCWCLRANSDWGARSWRQWCATPMLYPQPATSNRVVRRFLYRRRPTDSKSASLAMMALGDCGQCRVGSEAHVFRRTNMDGDGIVAKPSYGQRPVVTKRLWTVGLLKSWLRLGRVNTNQ
jgi:hypothetical protein